MSRHQRARQFRPLSHLTAQANCVSWESALTLIDWMRTCSRQGGARQAVFQKGKNRGSMRAPSAGVRCNQVVAALSAR